MKRMMLLLSVLAVFLAGSGCNKAQDMAAKGKEAAVKTKEAVTRENEPIIVTGTCKTYIEMVCEKCGAADLECSSVKTKYNKASTTEDYCQTQLDHVANITPGDEDYYWRRFCRGGKARDHKRNAPLRTRPHGRRKR